MTIQGVRIEIHLGVERKHVALAGHHQRIDFEHGRIGFQKRAVQRHKKLGAGFNLTA